MTDTQTICLTIFGITCIISMVYLILKTIEHIKDNE